MRDLTEGKYKGKLNKRFEFNRATRKNIAASAGYKCAIRRCLKSSTCGATNKGGTSRSVNFGKASHIYAASPNGPRPAPPTMTPEEITHFSNGIWTCSDCGDIVDRLECDYSPAQLIEMKKVREAAAKMAASDTEISGISRYISPIEFDEVFWENLPNLEEAKIRSALKIVAARNILCRGEQSSRDISLPSDLQLKPLANAIKKIIEDGLVSVRIRGETKSFSNNCLAGNDYNAARRRAAEIVDSWADSIQDARSHRTGWHIHHVNVLIAARHPQTSIQCGPLIRVVGSGHGRHDHTSDEGEVLNLRVNNTCSLVSNLNWQLEVAFNKGMLCTNSVLSLGGRLTPRDFYSPQWEEEFDAYDQVLRKLAEGWQPIGFVGMTPNPSTIDIDPHPEAFEIKLQITAPELQECLYRSSKTMLARKLQEQWGWAFAFTEVYFERALDFTMIQSASDELREQLGPTPYYYRGESPPLVSIGRHDIKFVATNGVITFKSVLRRS